MSDDIMDHMELQRIVRHSRDPEVLIGGQGAEPELIKLLSYLQAMPPGTANRPDYKYLRRVLTAIKDRKGLQSQLEWIFGYNETSQSNGENSQ
jgi:hypothetical protein